MDERATVSWDQRELETHEKHRPQSSVSLLCFLTQLRDRGHSGSEDLVRRAGLSDF